MLVVANSGLFGHFLDILLKSPQPFTGLFFSVFVYFWQASSPVSNVVATMSGIGSRCLSAVSSS